jgi:hypothetical protein
MSKLKLIIENDFLEDVTGTSDDYGITVFERVFNKLLSDSGSLGKVQPIYIKTNNGYKIFGIITLNKSGSYSFFPELADGLPFDHVTFTKDLSKNSHHYTRISRRGREKILPLYAEHLSNGTYHALSFACDPLFLKNAPKEVNYPEVKTCNLKEISDAFLTAGKPQGSTLLDLSVSNDSTIFIQFFLIPKTVDYRKMMFYPDVIKNFKKTLK